MIAKPAVSNAPAERADGRPKQGRLSHMSALFFLDD
jgi:hypothetical protein